MKCSKAQLEFNAANEPVLLINTISHPAFSRPVHIFIYGFKFTIPNNYKGNDYCVAVDGASRDGLPLGGVVYQPGIERSVEGRPACFSAGSTLGTQCVPGLTDDERMIMLAGGSVVDGDAQDCGPSNCSLNNLMTYLASNYDGALLTSFRPGTCQ